MKYSVIIPNYNGLSLLKENLPAVCSAFSHSSHEIIITDDHSSDDSIPYITENYPSVKLLTSSVNRGFSTNVNTAAGHAKGEWLILLNTDVRPHADFLRSIEPYLQMPKTFAIGFLQHSIENGKVVDRGRGIGSFRRGFLMHSRGAVDKTNTLWVSGGAGCFNAAIWKKLGGLCTLYDPFYWEDIDLSYRAQKAGYHIYFEPKSIVTHDQKNSSIRKEYEQRKIKRIAYRNQILFVWLNIDSMMFYILHLLWLPFHIVQTVANRDFAFNWGLVDALQKIGTIVKIRNARSLRRVLTDKQILEQYREKS